MVRWNGSAWQDISAGLGGLPSARVFHPDGSLLVGVTARVEGNWSARQAVEWERLVCRGRALDDIVVDAQGLPMVLLTEAQPHPATSSPVGQVR